MEGPPHRPKNAAIQALRGIAILLVLIDHYKDRLPTPDWLETLGASVALWTGVDFFFAISGFVILKSLFDSKTDLTTARLDVSETKSFWIKRAYRLFPAAWLWLFVGLVLSAAITSLRNVSVGNTLMSALSAMIGTANFYWADCYAHVNSYAQSIRADGPLSCGNPNLTIRYWSLSLEEQFYALAALASLLGGYRALAALAGVAIIGQLFLHRELLSWAWFVRTDALCWGVLVYGFSRMALYEKTRLKPWGIATMVLFCLFAILTAPDYFLSHGSLGLGISVVGLASGLAVWAASYDQNFFAPFRLSRSLVWIGERSYSLYLAHVPVIILCREIMVRSGINPNYDGNDLFVLVAPVAVGVSLLAADLSYRFIERPLIAMGRREAGVK